MSVKLHQMLQDLLAPTSGRQVEALLKMEQEWTGEEVTRFSLFLNECDDSVCVDLCPVLGKSKNARVIHVLATFANRDSQPLQRAALQALQQVAAPTRVHELCALLKSSYVKVRKEACLLMGTAGNEGRRPELLHMLRDEEDVVVLAALDAIKRLDFSDAVPEMEQLMLRSRNSGILLAAIQTMQVVLAGKLPAETLISLLQDEALSTEVRCAAGQALGGKRVAAAKVPLLHVLTSDAAVEIRCAAARALHVFTDTDVTTQLLRVSCSSREVSLKLACGHSLKEMPGSSLLKVCSDYLNTAELQQRLEIVILMGEIGNADAAVMLHRHLDEESSEAVRAACVESISALEGSASRDFLMKQMEKEPVVAYAALSAITELLDESFVETFVHRLAELDNDVYWEAALSALSLRGRSSRLPSTIYAELTPLFSCPHRHVAWLAADVAGWLRDKEITAALVDSMVDLDDENFRIVVTRTLRNIYRDDLLALVNGLAPGHLRPLEYIIRYSTDLGRYPSAVISRLAECAHEGYEGSRRALFEAGQLDPESFVSASEQVRIGYIPVLAEIWTTFPAKIRRSAPFHWEKWLTSPSNQLKLYALSYIDNNTGKQQLRQLIDMAMTEADAELRRAARRATRRVINAEPLPVTST